MIKADNIMRTAFVDAGVERTQIEIWEKDVSGEDVCAKKVCFKNDDVIAKKIKEAGIDGYLGVGSGKNTLGIPVYITGKLAEIVKKCLGGGEVIAPAAVLWSLARRMINSPEQKTLETLGIVELSASGYSVIAVLRSGKLYKDTLIVNSRCGAGSGVNLSRILQKLDIKKEEVDKVLGKFLGNDGKNFRNRVRVRTDRCGVFSSSATVSDKNQGIPVEEALAVTIKSEVEKACKKVPANLDAVAITGGVFAWQYARDCAADCMERIGIKKIFYDEKQSYSLDGLKALIAETKAQGKMRSSGFCRLSKEERLFEYPGFASLRERYVAEKLYRRLSDEPIVEIPSDVNKIPVAMALDIGSTMAKVVIRSLDNGKIIFLESYNNHGDTIETIKYIFRELVRRGIKQLAIEHIGITGSGRYQVQKVLGAVYPHLREHIEVLVENYAHARGSIEEARHRIKELKVAGEKVSETFCLLVDVGGEDTKVSVVSLAEGDLYDNAMNIKCSAGTGSLMDTLAALLGIPSINDACTQAYEALKGYGINATCAVFLMENARKMQAQGYPKNEILASCYWAIAENMARTLWPQVDFPDNAVVLLHGQTMLSDPLPLSITYRLQEYCGAKMFAVVPPHPGHRACLGLLRDVPTVTSATLPACDLKEFIDRPFERTVFFCHGTACGDKNSCCSRSLLKFYENGGKAEHITLAGCTAIQEMEAKRKEKGRGVATQATDAYTAIWSAIKAELPQSEDSQRLIIPRSFSVSDQAYFLAAVFKELGISVQVDSVAAADILLAQSRVNIDTCAPILGAIGQFMRLADTKHGFILVPQIDFLDTEGESLGRTCTSNQGGMPIAMHYASMHNPKARFHLFDIDLKNAKAEKIAAQLMLRLGPVFEHYKLKVTQVGLKKAVERGMAKQQLLRNKLADIAAGCIEEAIKEQRNVAVICAREYVLNPGVYDSHVGRLFREKKITAIPSYIFDAVLSKEFKYLYWKNTHHIMSIVGAVKDKKFASIIKHARLAEAIRRIEAGETKSLLGLSLVSTFRCGPDSMIIPTIQELTKKIPFLIIQSDAAINELAHLENRVNTFLRQIEKNLHQQKSVVGEDFRVEFLEDFAPDILNKQTDVLYFPTLGDNRMVVAALRAQGYDCIDNYEDENYDPIRLIKLGRKYAGDAVCAPFAGVFADTILAIQDFISRKNRGELAQKKRVYIFNNKGNGPCRQGQYYEQHRTLLYRELKKLAPLSHGHHGVKEKTEELSPDGFVVKYLVGSERSGFNVGLEEWGMILAFQTVILQGVLYAIFFKGASLCRNSSEYASFLKEFRAFKRKINWNIEHKTEPSPLAKKIVEATKSVPAAQMAAKYFGFGLYNNNGLRSLLARFTRRWLQGKGSKKNQLKVHIDGEAYMRVAQLDQIHNALTDMLGFGRVEITHSPLWVYLEYLLNNGILNSQEKVDVLRKVIEISGKDFAERENDNETKVLAEATEKRKILARIAKGQKEIRKYKQTIWLLRSIFAAPLYRAAGLPMPHPMSDVLEHAKLVLPTLKPHGELAPYSGEAIVKFEEGVDLFLNIAPEGCMVSSMGELLTEPILAKTKKCRKSRARIQSLFSLDGEINVEVLHSALLKILGPEKFYSDKS